MAFLQVTLFSQSLMRTVPVNVILPADKMTFPGQPERPEKPYPTLYLLHGVFGSCIDWVSGTRIQRFAEENDLAVVMPSGDNAFYVDQPKGHNNYGEYIGQELVRLTRKMFPLSRKREDTFIGGLSMGGYGALRNGLKYSDTFGAVIALSGALHMEEIASRTEDKAFFLESKSYAEACFGDLTHLLNSDKDPKCLVRQILKEGKELPAIYMACGNSDSLLSVNWDMAAFLKENGANVTFEQGSGAHEWDFWDRYIKKAIDWLPLEKGTAGISSGNVGI
jgi:S-formylglutathione hydrolase FrmB